MLERLDPLQRHDLLSIDHYARYSFVLPLVRHKKVLDIACGMGYGSYMIACSGASVVVGMDVSEEAIEYAQRFYRHERIGYKKQDLLDLKEERDLFDLVVSFETLEHVLEVDLAIANLRKMLNDSGILVVSIPNDLGRGIENKYHVHKFTEEEMFNRLSSVFLYVDVYYQVYASSSLIFSKSTPPQSNENLSLIDLRSYLRGDLREEKSPDCFIFVCSDSVLPNIGATSVHSRFAWNEYTRSWHEYEKDLISTCDRLWTETQHWHRAWQTSEEQRAALSAEYERLWSEVQHWHRAWQTSEEQRAALSAEYERLWSEVQHWHRAWQTSEEQRAALSAEYERLWSEVQHWHRAWQTSEEQRAALSAEYERLWSEVQHWHRAWQTSEEQRAALSAEYERLWSEVQHWLYVKGKAKSFLEKVRCMIRKFSFPHSGRSRDH